MIDKTSELISKLKDMGRIVHEAGSPNYQEYLVFSRRPKSKDVEGIAQEICDDWPVGEIVIWKLLVQEHLNHLREPPQINQLWTVRMAVIENPHAQNGRNTND